MFDRRGAPDVVRVLWGPSASSPPSSLPQVLYKLSCASASSLIIPISPSYSLAGVQVEEEAAACSPDLPDFPSPPPLQRRHRKAEREPVRTHFSVVVSFRGRDVSLGVGVQRAV